MRKVIVSGANGFVGTALCKQLAEQNIIVYAIIKSKDENIVEIKDLPNLHIVYCELSNFSNLPSIISDRNFDAFYHLAWVGTSGSLRGCIEVQLNNIRFSCDAIKSSAELQCEKFIFASSIMEYEIEETIKKGMVSNINMLYSCAKVSADYMIKVLADALDVNYIRAVISNIYGPGEHSQRLINTTIKKLLINEKCEFSVGEQMYDFIYITDAIKAFVAIGEKGIRSRTYYIGSMKPKPLKFFLKEMCEIVNPDCEIVFGAIPFNGVSIDYETIFDIHAVKNDTGFVPKISYGQGIVNTAQWIKENM